MGEFVCTHNTKGYRGSSGTVPLIPQQVSGHLHALVTLPLVPRLGGPQSQSGLLGLEKDLLLLRDLNFGLSSLLPSHYTD